MKTENEMALTHLAYSQWVKGYQKGWNEGRLYVTLNFMKIFGIDESVSLSGIPRSVLEEHIDDNR